jgi:L-lactate dehydrogenase complex protein LldG
VEREAFLGRVRASLRGAVLPDPGGPGQPPPIHFDDPVTRFVDQARGVSAEVTRVDNLAEVLEAVAGIMGETKSFVAWDDIDSIVPAWEEHVAANGLRRVDAAVGDVSRTADHDRVGAVTIGVTGADVAIAATGTVVLAHGPGRPRSASLLVEHHIVLLPVDRIVPSLADAFERVDWGTSNVVAITGPSRTGDIESILTLGVHGPRHLHIVLIG